MYKIKSIPLFFHFFSLDTPLFKQCIGQLIKYPIKVKNSFDRVIIYKIRGKKKNRKRKHKEASRYPQRTVRGRALRFYTKKETLHANSIT